MEKVKFKIEVIDNYLEIIPLEPLKDNSVYTIKINDLKSTSGDFLDISKKIVTKITPLYSTIYAVKTLIDGINIPEDVILYHIREASRFVDYMKEGMEVDEDDIPFEVSQFVKYKAAYECILRYSVQISSSFGVSGTVGEVSFSERETTKDISSILKDLAKEADKWKDEVRGFKLEGRAKMKATVRGGRRTPKYDSIDLTMNREV